MARPCAWVLKGTMIKRLTLISCERERFTLTVIALGRPLRPRWPIIGMKRELDGVNEGHCWVWDR